MKLHENQELFRDAILSASRPVGDGGLGIGQLFIEKDYWICRSLKLMVERNNGEGVVLKGGTSLTKAYGIGNRFSEDIDIAISNALALTGNQLKNQIHKTAHDMTQGLEEIFVPEKTSKGSRYYRAYFRYPSIPDLSIAESINLGQILVEINSFGNPYPCERIKIESFLTAFLRNSGEEPLIEEYNMQPFMVYVLDKARTLTEKIVSLTRASLADDFLIQLSSKIRHFYDIHYLLHDESTRTYLNSKEFIIDFNTLFRHDRSLFNKPEGWLKRSLNESPLLTSPDETWTKLESTYLKELGDLSYSEIPTPSQILESLRTLISRIREAALC